MDSRAVNKKIRGVVWPQMASKGFDEFTSRNAWRNLADQIHVVNFQSFNSYLAEGLHCTTFSFSINLGVKLTGIPSKFRVEVKNEFCRPDPSMCEFRHGINRDFAQKEIERPDIWFVREDGSNVDEVVTQAAAAIMDQALPWFGRFRNLRGVLNDLLEGDETLYDMDHFGRPHTPAWNQTVGHLAKLLGEEELAEKHLDMYHEVMDALEERLRSAKKRSAD